MERHHQRMKFTFRHLSFPFQFTGAVFFPVVIKLEKDSMIQIPFFLFPQRIPNHRFCQVMESGKFSTVLELAQYLKSDRSHVARTLSLVNLAPDIATAVMSGKAPETLTLTKVLYGFPDNWQEQRKFLGMA